MCISLLDFVKFKGTKGAIFPRGKKQSGRRLIYKNETAVTGYSATPTKGNGLMVGLPTNQLLVAENFTDLNENQIAILDQAIEALKPKSRAMKSIFEDDDTMSRGLFGVAAFDSGRYSCRQFLAGASEADIRASLETVPDDRTVDLDVLMAKIVELRAYYKARGKNYSILVAFHNVAELEGGGVICVDYDTNNPEVFEFPAIDNGKEDGSHKGSITVGEVELDHQILTVVDLSLLTDEFKKSRCNSAKIFTSMTAERDADFESCFPVYIQMHNLIGTKRKNGDLIFDAKGLLKAA